MSPLNWTQATQQIRDIGRTIEAQRIEAETDAAWLEHDLTAVLDAAEALVTGKSQWYGGEVQVLADNWYLQAGRERIELIHGKTGRKTAAAILHPLKGWILYQRNEWAQRLAPPSRGYADYLAGHTLDPRD